MRGKEHRTFEASHASRITPAYAGKSLRFQAAFCCIWDHPRLCGEKDLLKKIGLIEIGSPPPMRGKEKFWRKMVQVEGITPAYAGKRQLHKVLPNPHQDHPRLCGEKVENPVPSRVYEGSPPPMRGKGVLPFRVLPFRGITPAYAGKSLISQAPDRSRQDHPRLCGEKYLVSYHTVGAAGSPPPMRGKVTEAETVTKEDRITPAYAGKSPAGFSQYRDHWDHPRLCGEKSDRSATCFFKSGSPPPMRGKVYNSSRVEQRNRITPAYAGKRPHCHVYPRSSQDHPRLCGEKWFDL